PALVAYAIAAFLGTRAVVDTLREQFGSRDRLRTLADMVPTLGFGGLLYYAAFRIEWHLRADMPMKGVAAEAERIAVARAAPKPFPIELVITGIVVVCLVL